MRSAFGVSHQDFSKKLKRKKLVKPMFVLAGLSAGGAAGFVRSSSFQKNYSVADRTKVLP